MKKEFLITNAKFVYSKNELGYQEVLDSFEIASEITIITYNISEKKNALVSALKKVGEHCIINIITNIPSRWETYYVDCRVQAESDVSDYRQDQAYPGIEILRRTRRWEKASE